MIILGIDPGSRRIGYGVVETGNPPVVRGVGIFTITKKDNPAALSELRQGLERLIKIHAPTHLAIEKLFFLKNRTTGIAVAEARGVILVAAQEAGLIIHEYSPNEIKLALTGDGGADKKAVSKMVRLLVKLPPEKLVDDATDALGIALVAAQRIPLAERLR
jgi:crossover junction endodeoxyribonuclease RuvC